VTVPEFLTLNPNATPLRPKLDITTENFGCVKKNGHGVSWVKAYAIVKKCLHSGLAPSEFPEQEMAVGKLDVDRVR